MKNILIYIKSHRYIRYLLLVITCYIVSSCEDFISVDPPLGQLVRTTVFSDDLTAKSAMYGMYGRLAFGGGALSGGQNGLSFIAGLSSDELRLLTLSDELLQFNENALLSTNTQITNLWNEFYGNIYLCNSLIEGLNSSTGVTPALKEQLTGEGLFIRALIHFYLTNLFGKVPYISTTDYEKNTAIGRMEISDVYQEIINDLIKAKRLMSLEYPTESGLRTRANSLAASALLAKVYLFADKNLEAENEASLVIDNPLYKLEDLTNVFTINSQEAILQFEYESYATFTLDGDLFAGPETRFVQSITTQLVESFEAEDLRVDNWILELDNNGTPTFAPYKYKDSYEASLLNEYSTLLRLGDIILVRAEARARQEKLDGANSALSDLNTIRDRAGLDPLLTMTETQTLDAILLERQHELFVEWGARWIDLKRFGRADEVLGPLKSDWEPTDVLYPLPFEETLVNLNLPQNDGYN
ncbi:RagB/SusD family nutrient uptake outer membrane protein [Fulvivirgaceae bacterium PWU5]|uniref:RagB/SusD family nutrient uptake outer membrane protein n=1 Tax=Dawidia cretensis TaxID=2782350 RepID=A0AAP2E1D7_9BACT|nr:RagB/SusD family nutrient uptake outer membrane protein [Dawidia cretensis]MBT1711320.1 RagB/SusD family nutrient uptake outer membrane protein [Dawidia cretensis]